MNWWTKGALVAGVALAVVMVVELCVGVVHNVHAESAAVTSIVGQLK